VLVTFKSEKLPRFGAICCDNLGLTLLIQTTYRRR